MFKNKLKYGLNITKPNSKTNPVQKKKVFDDDNLEESDNDEQVEEKTQSTSLKQTSAPNLSHLINSQKSTTATTTTTYDPELDPSIYDYDGVYDAMKLAQKIEEDKLKGEEENSTGPKYFKNMIQSSNQRKLERKLAEEKMIQKEREKEGEEFKDKEKFVTEAYKKQMEELKQFEEESKNQDIKGNIQNFYKQMLNQDSAIREAAINIQPLKSSNASISSKQPEEENQIGLALKSGKKVALNDDNQIIDKRELLNPGLNIPTKPKKPFDPTKQTQNDSHQLYEERKREKELETQRKLKLMNDQRKKIFSQQLMERQDNTQQEEENKARQLEDKLKRKNDDESLMSAKERYLARKKAKEAEQQNN